MKYFSKIKMSAKVSVIIPCYNYENYIEQCVMSVLLQKIDFDIEILIGDDNSLDNSFIIASRLKNYYESDRFKFKLIKHENNVGEINNTKSLLENSTGEYIAYLDADDYWTDPYKLKKQIEFMDNNPEYSMCITGHILLENNSYVPVADFSSWLCPTGSLDSHNLSKGNYVGSSSSRVFRNYTNLIKDYFYEFPYSDWVLNFELSFRGKIEYLNFPSYVYRIHNKSLSKKDRDGDLEFQNRLYEKRISILNDILNEKLYNSENV